MNEDLREALAAYAHTAWAKWMRYLFSKAEHNPDGTLTIPAWAAARWRRQMQQPYAALSSAEQASDLAEADAILCILKGA